MPTHGFNPSVYSGGAVPVDLRPFDAYYMRQIAQRQARDQTLEQYYRDQSKALTPTGMRAKDIEGGWAQKADDWQKFGIENKKFLLNPKLDGYKSVNEFNRRRNELQTDIARSKEAGEHEKTLFQLRESGKWNPTNEDMDIAHDNSLPIYDKSRKNLGIDGLSINTPALDMDKFRKSAIGSRSRGTASIGEPIYDSKTGEKVYKTEDTFNPSDIKSVADQVPAMIQNDRSANIQFGHALESNMLPELQKAYSSIYPNGGLVDTPAKAAQAHMIMEMSSPTNITEKREKWEDPEKKMRDAKELARLNSSLRMNEAKYKQDLKAKVDEAGGANSYMDTMLNDATPSHIKKDTGEIVEIFDIKSSPADRKMFSVNKMNGDKKVTIDPARLILSKDKKYITPIFYQGEEVDGNRAIDKDLSQPVLVEQYAARLGKELGGTTVNKEAFGVPSKKKGASKVEVKIENLRNKYGYHQ